MNQNQSMEVKTDENLIRSIFEEPSVRLSKDGQYLTLILSNNVRVRKHVNYFKAILGIPFTPRQKELKSEGAQ